MAVHLDLIHNGTFSGPILKWVWSMFSPALLDHLVSIVVKLLHLHVQVYYIYIIHTCACICMYACMYVDMHNVFVY